MKPKGATKALFSIFLLLPVLIFAAKPTEKFTDISGQALVEAIDGMNRFYQAFLTQRDISDYMEFQRQAQDPEASAELRAEYKLVNEQFSRLTAELSHTAFSSLFQEEGVYRIAKPCAIVVTDIYYDEEKVGKVENPPILDLIMTVICESKEAGEPVGTVNIVVTMTPELQKEFEAIKFTLIDGIDTELFQPSDIFKEYLGEGVLTNVKIRLYNSGARKASWEPPVMTPGKKGIFTLHGELVSPGRLAQ